MTCRWIRNGATNAVLHLLLASAPLGVLAVPRTAAAHQVWLEPSSAGTKLYFGEFGDNLHEVSPGYLDKLEHPTATLLSAQGEKPLEAKKGKDGFVFAGRLAQGEAVVAADLAYPILEAKAGGKTVRTAWTRAARFTPELRAQGAKLTLDIVPTNGAGEFQVSFRGVPLARAEVSLVAVSGWSLQSTTDDKGKVTFRLPWKGIYALLVRHKEAAAGTRKTQQGTDEAYDGASFATTLTFVTSSGLPSPPAPPAAAPNALK
jgi:Domain of unknown function (DUF4198)